eukprot:scaffold3058_cov165-Ochromonas_danica.AAC.10
MGVGEGTGAGGETLAGTPSAAGMGGIIGWKGAMKNGAGNIVDELIFPPSREEESNIVVDLPNRRGFPEVVVFVDLFLPKAADEEESELMEIVLMGMMKMMRRGSSFYRIFHKSKVQSMTMNTKDKRHIQNEKVRVREQEAIQ